MPQAKKKNDCQKKICAWRRCVVFIKNRMKLEKSVEFILEDNEVIDI